MAQYFEKYRGAEQVSLVNALAEMGENSTYSQRERIAAANGIANYTGTALQNLQMLSLLKSGDLIKPNGESQTSTDNTPPLGYGRFGIGRNRTRRQSVWWSGKRQKQSSRQTQEETKE